MGEMGEIEIIIPAVDDDPLCDMLHAITEAIAKKDENLVAHGFLGGEFGYGGHWNSAVFEMRPYYWGDCTCDMEERNEAWWKGREHAADCYQTELHAAQEAAGTLYSQERGLSYDERQALNEPIYDALCAKHGLSRYGCAVHCTCGLSDAAEKADIGHRPDCPLELPNFVHRASGLTVEWYKYIGRDMKVKNMPRDLSPILADCLRDIEGVSA